LNQKARSITARKMSRAALGLSRPVRRKEGIMGHAIDLDDPEHVIAILNRNRHIKVFAVVAGLILVLGVMLIATSAMYSGEPGSQTPAAPAK
jgi:hypothetical protein